VPEAGLGDLHLWYSIVLRHLSLPVADTAATDRQSLLVRAVERVSRGPTTALGTGLWLLGISAGAAAAYAALATRDPGPFIFADELAYERMAYSFAHTGRLALLGKVGLTYPPLYSIALSPIYALTSSAVVAYDWVKRANVRRERDPPLRHADARHPGWGACFSLQGRR
jgi:hypothetical protein